MTTNTTGDSDGSNPLGLALTNQLGLPERLNAMAAGWLCEGMPDADTLREAAKEMERLRGVVASVNSRCDHLGMRLGEVMRERDRLRELLRLVADEPNIDKARALADAELHGPNV